MDEPTIQQILNREREIWGDLRMALPEIVVCLGVIYGDICRYARENAKVDLSAPTELEKELGNLIASSIRYIDDLGLSAKRCVDLALECQKKFPK